MQRAAIQRVLGLLLMVFSITMLPPAVVSLIYADGAFIAFAAAFALILLLGLAVWFPVRRATQELRLRDGFLVVVLFWTVLGTAAALPFLISSQTQVNMTDAVFEAWSGLTTTGATVLVGLDQLPRSILYYRQQLQWFGGMGIIVLAVAIMPMLGVGGMQLYRAETPGPVKDNRLTPRIAQTAKALWYIYMGLTTLCMAAYWLAGMSFFDALGHSFSTVAIGGFSTHDASIGHFESTLIETVAVVFMLAAGLNFALHFLAWRGFTLRPYFEDTEARVYFGVLLVVSAVTIAYLLLAGVYDSFATAIHHGIFQVVSIGTTTGFTTAEYFFWPGFLPVLLLLVSFVGGCGGSTGGGIKVIRVLLLFKQGGREIKRLIHPSAQLPVKVGGRVLPDRVVESVWGFFALYVASFCVMSLMLAATGLDLVTSFSAVAACMNNLGPGLGQVGAHYADISDPAKWVLCFAMLLGRLEIFTLLVLFNPHFWRN